MQLDHSSANILFPLANEEETREKSFGLHLSGLQTVNSLNDLFQENRATAAFTDLSGSPLAGDYGGDRAAERSAAPVIRAANNLSSLTSPSRLRGANKDRMAAGPQYLFQQGVNGSFLLDKLSFRLE